MSKMRFGTPHVVRSEIVGSTVLSCRLKLLECVKKSVYRKLRGYKCNFLDDVIGDTYVDMIDYINKSQFDETRNIKPETYISQRLSGSIIDNYKKYIQSVKTPVYSNRTRNYTNNSEHFFDNSLYNATNTIELSTNSEEDHIENNIEHEYKPCSPNKFIDQTDIRKTLNEVLSYVKNTFKKFSNKILHPFIYCFL